MGARPDEAIEAATAAHARLVRHLDTLDDDVAHRPSRLPQWSVGHVLTHLARNADSFTRLFDLAAGGEIGDQYPGGAEQRRADIDAGAPRGARALADDVRASCARLEAVWHAASADVWEHGRGRTAGSRLAVPLHEIPFRRLRETEVHHADLGVDGYGPDDWCPTYVRHELDRLLMAWRAARPASQAGLPPAVCAMAPARRLAWLLGRVEIDGLDAPRLMA